MALIEDVTVGQIVRLDRQLPGADPEKKRHPVVGVVRSVDDLLGYVHFEEFGTAHLRSAQAEEVTVLPRTKERGPQAGRLTIWGEKERAHQLMVDGHRPAMMPRRRR